MPRSFPSRSVEVRLAAAGLLLTLGTACVCGSIGAADTIVLKNGRRIAALTVVEEGDKIRYQTTAGELSLPKSIVDHVEKGFTSVPPDSLSAAAAANLKITPPSVEAHAAIERGAVH